MKLTDIKSYKRIGKVNNQTQTETRFFFSNVCLSVIVESTEIEGKEKFLGMEAQFNIFNTKHDADSFKWNSINMDGFGGTPTIFAALQISQLVTRFPEIKEALEPFERFQTTFSEIIAQQK